MILSIYEQVRQVHNGLSLKPSSNQSCLELQTDVHIPKCPLMTKFIFCSAIQIPFRLHWLNTTGFLLFLYRHSTSGSCGTQPGIRVLSSLQSYFAMTDNHHQQAMDRLGQRSYFHSDFKGKNHDNVCPSMVRGIDFIRDPRLNKVNRPFICLLIFVLQHSNDQLVLFLRVWHSLWQKGRH